MFYVQQKQPDCLRKQRNSYVRIWYIECLHISRVVTFNVSIACYDHSQQHVTTTIHCLLRPVSSTSCDHCPRLLVLRYHTTTVVRRLLRPLSTACYDRCPAPVATTVPRLLRSQPTTVVRRLLRPLSTACYDHSPPYITITGLTYNNGHKYVDEE